MSSNNGTAAHRAVETLPTTTLPDEASTVEHHLHDKHDSFKNRPQSQRIFLFDVDGTLTVPRKHATSDMHAFIAKLRKHELIGIVGGSDLVKQVEQLGEELLVTFDYIFSENGLMSYRRGELIHQQSFVEHVGEKALQQFLNFVLHYIADLNIPVKRGTFIEFRKGMLNISPIGRNCSQQERVEFERYDKGANVRKTMIAALAEKFKGHPQLGNMKYSIGGQISFDVFPEGWDKTYCIQFLHADNIKNIHFFGDKTFQGGNDYEIYTSSHVTGHSVKTPEDTINQVREIVSKEDGVQL